MPFGISSFRTRWLQAALAGCATLLAACSPSSLVDVQSPSTVVDPSQVESATGATELRTNALGAMLGALGGGGGAIDMSGWLTDELGDNGFYGESGDDRMVLSTALSKNTAGYGYGMIQAARVEVRQARQALQQYAANAPTVPRAWQGEMYALEGYTIVYFAELYCSGIPLSESSLNGAQTLTRGFTTEEMVTRALAVFDSAIAAGADSARFVNLARVGKARALLILGQLATADTVVQSVPTDFVYTLTSAVSGGFTFYLPDGVSQGMYNTQDHEGGNGLVWSTDPRTGVVTVPSMTDSMLWPAKYNVNPSTGAVDPETPRPGLGVRVADGLEARLIQAEAALARGDASWLTTLNQLRATCVGTAACAPRLGLTSAQLPPLTDPGAATRLDTLMKERAMWLYLTGHREGDLRRLAHVYSRDPHTLWPTGTISQPPYGQLYPDPGPNNGRPYGSDMVYGPDVAEAQRNPLYTGCANTNP